MSGDRGCGRRSRGANGRPGGASCAARNGVGRRCGPRRAAGGRGSPSPVSRQQGTGWVGRQGVTGRRGRGGRGGRGGGGGTGKVSSSTSYSSVAPPAGGERDGGGVRPRAGAHGGWRGSRNGERGWPGAGRGERRARAAARETGARYTDRRLPPSAATFAGTNGRARPADDTAAPPRDYPAINPVPAAAITVPTATAPRMGCWDRPEG